MQNDESKNKHDGENNLVDNNSPSIEPLEKKRAYKSSLSLSHLKVDASDPNAELNKFNSDGFTLEKKFRSTDANKAQFRGENIVFKGENGNHEIFEIKLDKREYKDFSSHRISPNRKNIE